jgi:hypothetical protein
MQTALKLNTKVLPGHRIEIMSPDFPEGIDVEVLVTLPQAPEDSAIASRFAVLATRWYQETATLSSISQIAMHPAYQEIIGIGREAVPFILRELQQQPHHWFWALRAITGVDPIPAEHRGKIREMTDAWLQWGQEHGYLS